MHLLGMSSTGRIQILMSSTQSVSTCIGHLKIGDLNAAQELWNRYASRLAEIARRKLRDAPVTIADEDDIAASVFRSVCRGAAAGRFADINNRDDLWWLLLAITKQKVVDQIRYESAQKRGRGNVRLEVDVSSSASGEPTFSLDDLVGDSPTPDLLVMLEEQSQRLLELLRDDRLRRIAVSRIEGYTVPEIADSLAVSARSVERKLQLIRKAWGRELLVAE
jgi:DNA-directed RNA polymerase specialized sigma24 family protein